MKSMIFLLCILAAGIGGAFYLKSKTVEVTQVMEQINTGKIDPNTLDMAKKLLENPELKNQLLEAQKKIQEFHSQQIQNVKNENITAPVTDSNTPLIQNKPIQHEARAVEKPVEQSLLENKNIQQLDTNSQKALIQTQNALTNPGEREAIIRSDSNAKKIDENLKNMYRSEDSAQKTYELTADILSDLVQSTAGDPQKLQQLIESAQKDPEKFYNSLSPEQKKKIKGLSHDTKMANPANP